jgi:hypothetical protein
MLILAICCCAPLVAITALVQIVIAAETGVPRLEWDVKGLLADK